MPRLTRRWRAAGRLRGFGVEAMRRGVMRRLLGRRETSFDAHRTIAVVRWRSKGQGGPDGARPRRSWRLRAHGDEPVAVEQHLAAAELGGQALGRQEAPENAVARAVVEHALVPALGVAAAGA